MSIDSSTTTFFGEAPVATPLPFRRGWILTPRNSNTPLPDEWSATTLGHYRLDLHPSTRCSRTETHSWSIALIGYPIDLTLATSDSTTIGERIASKLGEDGLSSAALRYIAYLGGRFVTIAVEKHTTKVWAVPDATASMPIFWSREHLASPILASHSRLIANHLKLPPDERARRLLESAKRLGAPGTIYLPGALTHWSHVKQVLANHYLDAFSTPPRQKRFYPFHDTSLSRNPETAYNAFVELFERHVGIICQLGKPGISLTGGRDSQCTLAAALPYITPQTYVWTFHKSTSFHQGIDDDLKRAHSLSRQLGLNHTKVDVSLDPDPSFEAAFTTTMGHGHQMRRLPEAYNQQIPEDVIELNSMVAETGTGFYKRRDEAEISAERLALLYSRSDFGRSDEVVQAYEEYISDADFSLRQISPLDYHDIFYWENRIGRWGAQRIQEVDMTHLVMLPFNSRGIIEALMVPEFAKRADKQALTRYIEGSLSSSSVGK